MGQGRIERVFLALLVLGAPLLAQGRRLVMAEPGDASAGPAAPRPGNVLLLVADDLGVDMVGAYGVGEDPPPTPNLDQLAAGGVLFRNAWSQPTCSPTRATLQTGRYGFRTGIGRTVDLFGDDPGLPLEELTLPEMLDLGTGALYAHAAIGKWHLDTEDFGGNFAPNLAGYAHFAGSLGGQIQSYTSWLKVEDGVSQVVTRYATSENVDEALAWIGEQDSIGAPHQPWFCVVNFQAPHTPFHRPPDELHTRVLPEGDPKVSCGASVGNDPAPYHAAMVETLDTEIGRLLDGIPAAARTDTTVIFLGDNGTDGCLAEGPAKGTLYEGGIRVPFLVAGASVARAGECHALVNTSDVFATVAEIAGVDLAETFPGVAFDSVSLLPYLRRPDEPSLRAWIHSEMFTPNGPGNPLTLPECPERSVCQDNIGYDGPGDAALSICGLPLYGVYGANLVPIRLVDAPPFAETTLRIGPILPTYIPEFGALVISGAPSAILTYQTDAAGVVARDVWTGGVSHDLYYQMVVEDPTAEPAGYSVTNAVRIDPLWSDMRAIRNERYKLIRFHPCREELYDLLTDPLEAVDLLLEPVAPEALAAYEELTLALDSLR